jgi:hypothetical protein
MGEYKHLANKFKVVQGESVQGNPVDGNRVARRKI